MYVPNTESSVRKEIQWEKLKENIVMKHVMKANEI